MKLILKSNNSTEALSSYLKKFTKLRKSLLLEIDPFEQKFVAKSFSEDHSVVRYSALTFSDANFEVVSCDDMSYKQRIKLGMTVNLDKFIKIIDRFDSNYNLSFSFQQVNLPDGTVDYHCDNVYFDSNVLKMKVNGSKITDFQHLTDEVFNTKVFNVNSPINIPVSSDTIQNILKTADIVSVDIKKDSLVFFTRNSSLYVKDYTGLDGNGVEKEPNFEYCILTDANAINYDFRLPISRERIVQVLTDSKEDYTIIVGKDVTDEVSRIMFSSNNSDTKIVVSRLNDI
jgi:hypothetical protein